MDNKRIEELKENISKHWLLWGEAREMLDEIIRLQKIEQAAREFVKQWDKTTFEGYEPELNQKYHALAQTLEVSSSVIPDQIPLRGEGEENL